MNRVLIIGVLLMIAGAVLSIYIGIHFGFFKGYLSAFTLFVPGYWIAKHQDDRKNSLRG